MIGDPYIIPEELADADVPQRVKWLLRDAYEDEYTEMKYTQREQEIIKLFGEMYERLSNAGQDADQPQVQE